MQDAPTPTTAPATTGAPRRYRTTAVVCAGGALTALDLKVVNVALPQIGLELGSGLAGLQWVVNGYTLAFASLVLTMGALSDRLGGWRIFGAGVTIFTLASVGCGLAPGIGALVAFRMVQGIGAAMILATSIALLARAYTGPARAGAIGAYVTVGTATANLAPLLGGVLVDGFGWRSIFLINLPLGALVLAALPAVARGHSDPGTPGPVRSLDLGGAALATLTFFAFNVAVLTGSAQGWTRPEVPIGAAASAVGLVAFVVLQLRRGDRALVDLRLFRIRSFTGAILLSLQTRIVSFGALPFFVLWMEGMLGASATATGFQLLTMSGPVLLMAVLAGRIQRVLPARVMIAVGNLCGVAAGLLLLRIGPDSPWWVAAPGFALIGLGAGLVFPPLMGIAVGVVPPERAGMASGMANTFFPLGTALGVAVFGAASTAAIDRAGLPGPVRDSVVAGRFAAVPPELLESARESLVSGLHVISASIAVLCALGALAAITLVRDGDRVSGH